MKIGTDAARRYAAGEAEHGVFDPAADKRDLIREAYEELLDARNYLLMHRQQLMAVSPEKWDREINRKWSLMYALALELARELLEFKHDGTTGATGLKDRRECAAGPGAAPLAGAGRSPAGGKE